MAEDCVFCRIIEKRIPTKFEFEDNELVAIQDIHPQAPVHLLVIPKKHIAEISNTGESDRLLLGSLIVRAKELARQRKVEDGYRLVQTSAKKVWDEKKTLKEVVLKSPAILKYLTKKEIQEIFNYQYHLKHVDTILRRVGILTGRRPCLAGRQAVGKG